MGGDIRAFCVYATGTVDCPNHAEILLNGVKRYKLTRSKQNRTTDNLAKEFQHRIISSAIQGDR
jgi:hypothetical protein